MTRTLRAGPVSCLLDGVDLRYLRVGEVEVIRRIYAAVRDHNWNTIPGVAEEISVTETDDGFEVRFTVHHRSADLGFSWDGSITGKPDGAIRYAFSGAAARPLRFNRIGICVLHPARELGGRRWRARTPDGEVEGALPTLIAPQPFEDGVHVPLVPGFDRLEIELPGGAHAELELEGDLWETEDQRNWSDDSLKSYCTPLALGFPHDLHAGERVEQAVTSRVSGPLAPPAAAPDAPVVLSVGEALDGSLPEIGLGCGPELTSEDAEPLRELGLAHLRIEVALFEPGWQEALERALRDRERVGVAAELAVHLRAGHGFELSRLAGLLAGVPLARVLAYYAGGRSSEPEETTPAELVELVRESFGGVQVGGGTDLNFCELNRTRPQVGAMDVIGYPIAAQVHAFDDLSVMETTAAQGDTARTAATFAGGCALAVGPVTLRRRFNAVATEDEPQAEPEADPRQRSQLLAAWTLASAKYLGEGGAGSVTYFETAGPRGVVEGGDTFPVYGVLEELCGLRGVPLRACTSSAPLRAVGLALAGGPVLVANLTGVVQAVAIEDRLELGLAPYETARIEL